MGYTVDKTNQLVEAQKRGRFGSVASLRAAGTPLRQHNVAAKKSSSAKKTAKKVAKSSAKKTAAKKAAKKS